MILKPGTGKRTINKRDFKEYFHNSIREMLVEEPLTALDESSKWDIVVSANGGGISGQAGATKLALARALVVFNEANRKPMREKGLLTRDARVVERKKYGKAGARRSFQFSKR